MKYSIIFPKTGGNYSTIYGMGDCQNWKKFTRDLHIDLVKGHVLSGRYSRLGNLNVYYIFGMKKKSLISM